MNVMIVDMNGVKVMVKESNDIDWAYQNALREQWLKDNPNAVYIGWMSI
jgi:hypothetical protein